MRTFIIRAGASKAYSESPTNCRIPFANDFFQTFNKLNISDDLRVHVGDIINICIFIIYLLILKNFTHILNKNL